MPDAVKPEVITPPPIAAGPASPGAPYLRVSRVLPDPHRAVIAIGGRTFACALGPAGIVRDKREGDGATPAGLWPLRQVFYRPDRVMRPRTALPVEPLFPALGWCDDRTDRRYNRPVLLPCAASAETMWRNDTLYDIVVVLGHNDSPPVPGRGSCIFFHLARSDYGPTEGCIAVSMPDMVKILAVCRPGCAFEIIA